METRETVYRMSELKYGVSELRELLRTMGFDPALINTKDLQDVADSLTSLANLPDGKSWGWKYLNQVLHDKLPASRILYSAILAQGALSDGVNSAIATGRRVLVYAKSGVDVHAGTLITRASRRCICGIYFIPAAWNSLTCSSECRKNRRNLSRRK